MSKFIDLTGQRFGRLIVIERVVDKERENKQHTTFWKCICDCGGQIVCFRNHLLDGHIRSCGCLHDENAKTSNKIHGLYHTRINAIWRNMIQRCTNPKNQKYYRYGGRGITVCEEWRKFENFYNWSIENGYDESLNAKQCTIDRKDNDGDYCPENCRWTTSSVQSGNRSDNVYLTFNGETHSSPEWEKIVGIPSKVISGRKRKGWTDEKCLTTPVRENYKKVICDNIIYSSITECAKKYNVSYTTMSGWLRNKKWMPKYFVNLGLDYYVMEELNEEQAN